MRGEKAVQRAVGIGREWDKLPTRPMNWAAAGLVYAVAGNESSLAASPRLRARPWRYRS